MGLMNLIYKREELLKQNSDFIATKIVDEVVPQDKPIDICDAPVSPSYAPKIGKENFIIDWSDNSVNIHNKIRALSYRGAYGFYRKKRVKFFDTFVYKSLQKNNIGYFYYKNNIIYIQTGKDYLAISKLQIEGGRVINANDYYNSIKEGPLNFE